MFFPKAMTEIELVVPAKDLVSVTKALGGQGVFHQSDSSYPGMETDAVGKSWQEKAAAFASLERRIQSILQTLEVEEPQPQTGDFEKIAEVEELRRSVDRIEQEVRAISDQLNGERKRLEQLESTINQLAPLAEVEVDIRSLRGSRYLFSQLGVMPAQNVERMKTSLSRVPHMFEVLRADPQNPVVWLAGTQNNADVLGRAARSGYLNPLQLPEKYDGKPGEVIGELRAEVKAAEKRISDFKAELAGVAASNKAELFGLLWDAHGSRMLAEAVLRFGRLRYTYVIVGWVISDKLDALVQKLKQASKEIIIESYPTQRNGHGNVPVALRSSKFLRPFQMLVTTYGRPNYGEVDPTLIMALTFPLLFGAMFGDIGQGLLLFVLGLLIDRKIILKGMSSLGLLIAYCGASAAIFGLLYGSVFGFEGEHFAHAFGFEFQPIWLSPIEKSNILQVLILAIDIGIVFLIVGFLIGIFNNLRSREWAHLVFGHTGIVAFVFYLSFLGLLGALKLPIVPGLATAIAALPIPFAILALICAIGVMFSQVFRNLMEGHRPLIEGGMATYAIQAPMELFETVIGFLSNTLSYVRVGAFAVAHGGLSLAIFNLAGEELGPGFWITVIIGNIIIILLEGLIVGIQTMRLHYYEFFGKFFTGGGTRFEPLRLTSVKEEE